ncbi:MAG TPA: polysaccharide biosynthesis/export family protein [Thermoanaerobaculia bacterium]|nr:polysaccharide biosynthesis/export family protein [Thermoanaerobaculia bacterium]
MKVLASALLTLALSVPADGQVESAGSRRAGAYRIGPRDEVSIRVFEAPNLDVVRRVGEDGTIQFPLLGGVQAAGKTELELAAGLAEALEADLLQRASVTVEVTDARSKPIRVVGAVQRPGDLDLMGPLSLLDVLTEAGGPSGGQGGSITVLRRADNGLTDELTIRLDHLLSGGHQIWNIPIFPNDVINVPQETPKTIYLLGELGSRGAIDFKSGERVTLLTAIARAGGLGERASNKVVIKREGPDGTLDEITASYKRILNGKDPDIELEHRDLILIRRSFL